MLKETLKTLHADTFAMYLRAHYFHWNVTGPNFSEYHAFFSGVYTELFAAVDPIAEHIRAIDEYAPGSFNRLAGLATIKLDDTIPSAIDMMKKLEADNKKVLASLYTAYKDAETEKEMGVANFLQDRIDAHDKMGWMLRSFTK